MRQPATEAEESQLVRVCRAEDVPPGEMREAKVSGKPIVVANVDGDIVAFQNACLHYNVRLSEGVLEGDTVICRWHQWEYCVRSGEVLTDESTYATMATFPVVVRDGDVYVAKKFKTKVTPRP